MDNPTVICSKHAEPFRKVQEEVDNDGTQTLVKQYWRADCGCAVEITLAIPDAPGKPS
jgi:hypothetical protein